MAKNFGIDTYRADIATQFHHIKIDGYCHTHTWCALKLDAKPPEKSNMNHLKKVTFKL